MSREKKASEIRTQLLKFSKEFESLSINEMRIILSIERIVARLEDSADLKDHLIFKGGFVLLKVLQSDRFTRDLDALCRGIEKEEAQDLILKALQTDLCDGFWFGDIEIHQLDEQGEYGAFRFDCAYQIGDPPKEKAKVSKLSRVHFDVGFGDKVLGKLTPITSPSLLPESEPLSWRIYPLEFIYSEKLETLVKRENANSRAKDVYDMVLLYKNCKNHEKLIQAIKATFKTRQTNIPESFVKFANDLNTRQLKSSWGSVQIADARSTFEDAWEVLQSQFKELDKLLS